MFFAVCAFVVGFVGGAAITAWWFSEDPDETEVR